LVEIVSSHFGVAVGDGVRRSGRHDEELAVVEDTVMHGDRGASGVADEAHAAVVADAERDVIADRAGVTGE
jgi:hypothetical protein